MLEELRSDLEAEVEKLGKQMKQLGTLPSDIEQLTKVHFHITYSYFVCFCACISGYMILLQGTAQWLGNGDSL